MSRHIWRWTAGIVASAILICGTTAGWLLATESGTRWLVARLSPLFPAALQIAEINGTLLKGMNLRSVSWTDDTVLVVVDRLDTRFELMPLLRKEVRINRLHLVNVNASIGEQSAPAADSAPFSLDLPVTLLLENASIKNANVTRGGNEFAIAEVQLGGQLSGSSLRIDRLEVQSELGDASLSGKGQLTGAYPVSAAIAWELRLPDQDPMSGHAELRGDASRYEIQHDLTTPYEIITSGTLTVIDGGITFDLANSWQVINIIRGDAGAIEFAGGNLNVSGTPDEFVFDGSTTVLSDDMPAIAVATRGQRQAEHVDFESVSVSNNWGRLLANGEVVISPEPSWAFDYTISDLDPALANQNLRGDLRAAGKTTGRIAGQQPLANVWIESLSGEFNGYPLGGSAALVYAGEQLQVNNAVVRVGDNRVKFDAWYGEALQVDASLQLTELAQLGLDARGSLNGDIHIKSGAETLAASGSLNGDNLGWKDYVVEKLSADFELPAKGRESGMIRIDFLTGRGQGGVQVDGRLADGRFAGEIQKLTVQGEQFGGWMLREAADFSISASQFVVSRTCLDATDKKGIACAEVDYEFSGPLRFDVSVNELPVAALPIYLPADTGIEGAIDAHATGEVMNRLMTADAGLEVHSLGLRAIYEGDEISAAFDRVLVKAAVVENRLQGELELGLANGVDRAWGSVEVNDLFDPQSNLRGHGGLELNDLSLFSFFYPDVTSPSGRISGGVDVAGNLFAPEIVGEIGLQDGSFGVRRAGITITNAELRLSQSKAGHLALLGSARSGEGQVDVSGETAFDPASGISTRISLSGEKFTLIQLPDWLVTASPSIEVLFDDRATRVSGQLGIPTANINVRTVPESAARPSSDVIVHRGDAPEVQRRRQLYIDVGTTLGENVSFSGFGLTTGLEGSVRITGSNDEPYAGSGRLALRDGRYRAYGQNLEIEIGELIFNGPLSNPALNIRATRTASDKTVAGIHLTGTPTQLRSEVYSEPALGDAEALSYLLTGRPLASADSEQGDMLNQAAFALGLTTAGSIASRVRSQLGLDTLGIQGGSENQQFVAGKRFGNRLFIEYAYGIIDNLGTLLLRYQLSSRLIVESRSGSVRNVDIVYSVKKK